MSKIDTQHLQQHFNNKKINIPSVIEYAKQVYETASRANKALLSSNTLINLVKQTCDILKMNDEFKRSIQFKLYDTLLEYRILGNQRTNTADIKSPILIRKLIENLWFNLSAGKKYSKPFTLTRLARRKITAVQTLFCFMTGRRWTDIGRLRWDCIRLHKLTHATCIKIPLGMSKANSKGRRNESICLIKDDSKLCPVKILTQFWILSGRPKVGFIFKCQHAQRKPKKFFYTSGRAYCCQGHKRGNKKVPCLGNIDGNFSYGIMAREALKVGFKKPPTKHTFRRLLVVMANKMGLSRDRICELFGWKHDSNMPSHYLADDFATSTNSLSFLMASEIKKDNLSNILNDVPIDN